MTHPNVIVVHDVGETDGEIFIVTELVDGQTMGQWQRGRSWQEITAAYAQAARGLAAAHAAGLVHRDIKPSNLLVGTDGRVRVCDFGLARDGGKPAHSKVTDGRIVGTPAYMAPEQRAGMTADARADQFALCLSLAEAMIGTRPPPDVSAEQLVRDRAPALVATVLARGLRLSPEQRLADLRTLATALDDCVVGRRRQPRNSRMMLVVGGIVAAGAAIGISLALTRHHAPPPAIVTVPRPVPITAPPAPLAPTAPPPMHVPQLPPVAARTASIDADRITKRLQAATHAHDAHACKRLLAVALPDAAGKQLTDLLGARAGCEMVSGDCDAGQRTLSKALQLRGDDPAVIARVLELAADNTCAVTAGDLATRVRRLHSQVVRFNPPSCDPYVEPALAAAAEPGLAALPNGHETVTQVIHTLGECLAREQHCDADLAMRTRAQAAGIELNPRMPPCRDATVTVPAQK